MTEHKWDFEDWAIAAMVLVVIVSVYAFLTYWVWIVGREIGAVNVLGAAIIQTVTTIVFGLFGTIWVVEVYQQIMRRGP